MKPITPKTPQLLKRLFPKYTWDISTEEKEVYLTFDDGPMEGITPWTLKTLNEFNAKATFFCIGNNIKKHPAIFNSIVEQGHAIGNHTYRHVNGWQSSIDNYLDEVRKCNEIIKANADLSFKNQIKLFRPPYGKLKPSQGRELIQLGYKIIMWDVLAYDWRQDINGEDSLNFVLNRSKNGSIIVFHDSKKAAKNIKYALPKCLEHFKKEGYNFGIIN